MLIFVTSLKHVIFLQSTLEATCSVNTGLLGHPTIVGMPYVSPRLFFANQTVISKTDYRSPVESTWLRPRCGARNCLRHFVHPLL